MMGMMDLCCTAEGLSNPTSLTTSTVAADASNKFLPQPHRFERGVHLQRLRTLDANLAIVDQVALALRLSLCL